VYPEVGAVAACGFDVIVAFLTRPPSGAQNPRRCVDLARSVLVRGTVRREFRKGRGPVSVRRSNVLRLGGPFDAC
jgi:hypothetical protein